MTLSTSADLRTARNYLFITLFTAFFGAVYEHFSFGVYSYYMIYAFAVPLALGVLPFLLLGMRSGLPVPPLGRRFWHTGVAVLTVGCIVKGVLDIYGTESVLVYVYWLAGPLLLLTGTLITLFGAPRKRSAAESTR